MHVDWQGVFPAATTHFHPDQSLDLDSTRHHIEIMIEAGIHGVIMLGTVGENCSLTSSEKISVLKATVDQVRGRIPVLTGVAECTTNLACRFAAEAEQVGCDGLMLLPAMVYKSDPSESFYHFLQVAGCWGLPILCYNNPVA